MKLAISSICVPPRGYTRGFDNFVIRMNVVVGNNYRSSM